MATKLFLRNTTTNGISGTGDGILYDMLTAAGASLDTAVTNTSASGTQIQATKTAGGSTIAWISGRAPSGGFTLTTSDISAWQTESNMNANIGGRYRIFKRTNAGVETELAGGPFDDGVEMGTTATEDTWTGNPTDTAFAEDDRILIRYYLTNVGTMAAAFTGTLSFNAADAATGDSFFNIAETVAFKAEGLALTGVSSTMSAGSVSPSLSKALTGNAITGAVGTVSVVQENIKVRDEYTDTDGTNATAHTADVGGPWTAHPASGASAIIASNRLTKDSSSSQALLIANATVIGNGYVETKLRMLTSISVNAGIAISVHPTNDDYVYARHNAGANEYSIRSVVSGSATAIGTATETLVANDERVMRLERRTVAGPHDEYRLLVAGVQVIGWTQSDGHTGTRVGIRLAGAASTTTGYALDRFEAGEFVVPSNDVSVALTGVSATCSVGTVTASSGANVTVALTGVSSTTALGSVTLSGSTPAIRVVQYNVQHGVGTDGNDNRARQIAPMILGTDIVCTQEQSTGDTGWVAGMAAAGFTQEIYRENGHGTDGPAIWIKGATVTRNATYDHALSTGAIGWDGTTNVDKAAVGLHVTSRGVSFYIFCTHLAWSAGADSNGSQFSSIRVAQIAELMSWINSIVGANPNVLIVGDMNFGPDYPKNPSGLQIDGILSAGYSDLWVDAIAAGTATAPWNDRDSAGGGDMPVTSLTTRTHDTRRIDYYFLRTGAQMHLTAIDLPDLRANCSGALTGSPLRCPDVASDQLTSTPDDYGVKPSDHNLQYLTLALSANATQSLSGVSTTAGLGSVAPSSAKPLTGAAIATGLGSLTVEHAQALTGNQSTTATGTVTPASVTDITLALTGVSTTTAVGSAAIERSQALTGVQSTTATGTLTPGALLTLSGNVASMAIGSVNVSATLALSGNAIISAAGSVTVSVAIPLAGVEASGTTGSVITDSDTSFSVALSGVSASCSVGSATASRAVPLTGTESATATGTVGLTKSGSISLTGVSTTCELGTATPGTAVTTTGLESVSAIGSAAVAYQIALTGAATVAESGQLSVSTSTGLTGVAGSFSLGSIGLGGSQIRTLNGQTYVTIADTRGGQTAVHGQGGSVKVRNGR